jgi:RHS repeat-associated protein
LKTVNGNYSYNGLHQLTSLTFSVPGSSNRGQMTFGYDTQDRLSAISRTMTGFGSLSFDTVNSTYSYDLANRLTGITYTDATKSTTLASFSYGYDAAGEVTSYTGPEGSMTYSYDKTGQLTGVSGAQNATFSFDANGNRNSTGYQTGTNNEMLNDGTFSYTYDHNGNTSTKTDAQGNVWTLTWDYRGRLAEVKEVNSLNQTVLDEKMTYDVFNHVIEVTLNGTVQRWTIFDGANPYMDLNSSGQMTARYITDPGALDVFFAKVTSAGALDWYLTDRLGSIREIVDKMAAVQDQITYGAFGNIVSESNPSAGDRFKWDGGEWDENTKLYHFGARWYDPATGRWASQDPLGLGPDSNVYRYSRNSPTTSKDPTGNTSEPDGVYNHSYSYLVIYLPGRVRPRRPPETQPQRPAPVPPRNPIVPPIGPVLPPIPVPIWPGFPPRGPQPVPWWWPPNQPLPPLEWVI